MQGECLVMLRCSHILCKVDDIQTAVSDYTELGFTMTWGSRPGKAHNALLWFGSGPFVEFFELPSRAAALRWPVGLCFGAAAGRRIADWARPGEGWRDVALETDDLDLRAAHTELKALMPVSRVMKGRRTRPDGQVVRYQFLAPGPAELPFVVSSYDPPQRPLDIVHANGATGIAKVHMTVAPADRAAYDAMIAGDPWLLPVPGERTGVVGVELAGTTASLDPAKLHGAQLVGAS
ncbi:VOC family protein [Kribbella sp. NBC_01245]|uniref:VOC family protein n=1 Tax=Kribbella sp. NBC_01245 TaxID=2903578 RepID=UPI002E2DEAA9|nr:VOC family protein [Kribbella sp. NBC_01245]